MENVNTTSHTETEKQEFVKVANVKDCGLLPIIAATAKGERKMRDKLLGFIKQAENDFANAGKPVLNIEEYVADYLLAKGVIVPPCKVGDAVYITLHPYTFLPLKKVVEGDVVSIHKHESGLFIRVLFDTKKISGCVDYAKWTWDERLFFTRGEAEEALAERSEQNDT